MTNKDHQRPQIHTPSNKKLTTQDRMDIVKRREEGESAQTLAEEYGVTARTIRNQ